MVLIFSQNHAAARLRTSNGKGFHLLLMNASYFTGVSIYRKPWAVYFFSLFI